MAVTDNYARMIRLAEEFFGAGNDPSQISVDRRVMKRLQRIHPATLTEKRTRNGPVAWVMVVPTTEKIMNKFVDGEINERELLRKTPLRRKYDAIYLCSALVLPEYRRKGIAKKLMLGAVRSVRKRHPIKALFYWAFSPAGKRMAVSVAKELDLPLFKRTAHR